MNPRDLTFCFDGDEFDAGPAYEVLHRGRPVGRVEQSWVPAGEPGRRCWGWRFEHVDGRHGADRTRHGAVLDGFAQPSQLTPTSSHSIMRT